MQSLLGGGGYREERFQTRRRSARRRPASENREVGRNTGPACVRSRRGARSSAADYFVKSAAPTRPKYWRNYDIGHCIQGHARGVPDCVRVGCKLALAVPTVQQAWASSGVRAGDRIVAVNGTAGPAEKLLSLLTEGQQEAAADFGKAAGGGGAGVAGLGPGAAELRIISFRNS